MGYPPSTLVLAVPLIARAQPRLLASGRFTLAEADGVPVGAGGWSPAGPGCAAVRHLVTDHRRVRQGIGRAVLGRAMAEARAEGVSEMVADATLTAVPFYAALGFRQIASVSVTLRPGIEFRAMRMRRSL